MKLATYYKARNEIVGLITDLSHANHCEKVYYRHDDINIPAPDDLYKYDNIDIGGYAIYDKYIYKVENGGQNAQFKRNVIIPGTMRYYL